MKGRVYDLRLYWLTTKALWRAQLQAGDRLVEVEGPTPLAAVTELLTVVKEESGRLVV